MARFFFIVAAGCILAARAAVPDQAWGYVDVRPGAHMFHWLYGCTNASVSRTTAPVVFWLQGGPGASSIGYGDYSEFGPLDVSLSPRNTTWIQSASVVFVENPVGSGFSYVDDLSLLTTNVSQVADDLVAFTIQFFNTYPELADTPFWVFCESYGGKMTVAFAQALLAAMDAGRVKVNFKGVALGDSWISAIDYVQTWGPWLRMLSVMDANELTTVVQPPVDQCTAAVAAGQWADATNYWGDVEGAIEQTTDNVDFYNVLLHNAPDAVPALSEAARSVLPPGVREDAVARLWDRIASPRRLRDPLSDLMNGPVKAQLGIPANVTWGGQSDAVFSAQSVDFMKPVVDIVDALLTDGRLQVVVYTGQLDLICATVGTEMWMNKLTWSGLPNFLASPKIPLYPTPGTQETGAFVRNYGNLTMYYIMDAGHMVPGDNGPMALSMLQLITGA